MKAFFYLKKSLHKHVLFVSTLFFCSPLHLLDHCNVQVASRPLLLYNQNTKASPLWLPKMVICNFLILLHPQMGKSGGRITCYIYRWDRVVAVLGWSDIQGGEVWLIELVIMQILPLGTLWIWEERPLRQVPWDTREVFIPSLDGSLARHSLFEYLACIGRHILLQQQPYEMRWLVFVACTYFK